jgi:hypothetical protein
MPQIVKTHAGEAYLRMKNPAMRSFNYTTPETSSQKRLDPVPVVMIGSGRLQEGASTSDGEGVSYGDVLESGAATF